MDALVGAGSLLAELVAGEVEHLEAVGVIFLVEGLQFVVLGCEATLRSGVYDEEHFVLILLQSYVFAFSVFDSEIINSLHFLFVLLV